MKALTLLKRLPALLLAACTLAACEQDDDILHDAHWVGNPLPENIVPQEGCVYEYNSEGLVVKIKRPITDYDENQQPVITGWHDVAYVTYPQSGRAVMQYVDYNTPTTYVFAFGENHFAHSVIETDGSGNYLIELTYDDDGHLTRFKRPEEFEEELRMQWTNGNLTRVEEDSQGAYTEISYGTGTDFATYHVSPFLLNVVKGPYLNGLGWWFDQGMKHALYLGFLGKPSVNLPVSMVAYDDINDTPEEYVIEYLNGYCYINGNIIGN